MLLNPILALAGRRIDAPGAPPRFPLERVTAVRERLRKVLIDSETTTLVWSAACGADLVGPEIARELGLRRRVVLPFAAEAFRETSVVDRPGDWGPLFDDLIAEARKVNDLLLMTGVPGEDAAYLRANEAILDEALILGGDPGRAAVALVWDGHPRGTSDATHAFGESARGRGLRVVEVLTG
jgi:hypothetical protein